MYYHEAFRNADCILGGESVEKNKRCPQLGQKVSKILSKKEQGSVIENMLVALIGIVMVTAFLVIIFGAFSGISDKWAIRQCAREYLLIMETEGYLKPSDQAALQRELESYGLYNISFSGTTTRQVGYGDRIYLSIEGTYNDNILAFASGISRVAYHPTRISINRQTTAKQ